mgnify:CR=1 FL=1
MNEQPVIAAPSELAAVLKYVGFAVVAGFGGAVKFLSVSLRTNTQMSTRRFLFLLGSNVTISAFSGVMAALIFSQISPDKTWQLAAAGVGGYMGTQLLDIVALAMTKRITEESVPVSAVIPIPASVDPGSPKVDPPAKSV